jgi:hypothetical protein
VKLSSEGRRPVVIEKLANPIRALADTFAQVFQRPKNQEYVLGPGIRLLRQVVRHDVSNEFAFVLIRTRDAEKSREIIRCVLQQRHEITGQAEIRIETTVFRSLVELPRNFSLRSRAGLLLLEEIGKGAMGGSGVLLIGEIAILDSLPKESMAQRVEPHTSEEKWLYRDVHR